MATVDDGLGRAFGSAEFDAFDFWEIFRIETENFAHGATEDDIVWVVFFDDIR